MSNNEQKHIAIIDFGSQYTHLIARNIREMNVLAKIHHTDVKISDLRGNVFGVILSGGPQSVYDKNSLAISKDVFDLGVPVLGICYGHQLMAHLLGGKVTPGKVREYGRAKLEKIGKSEFLEKVKNNSQVWMSHGDAVKKLPAGFEAIGKTKDCEITAMANEKDKFFGLQFHPEVEHSTEGKKMLENFVLKICGSAQDWKVENLVDDLCEKIKSQVGERKVFILVSGGVDSNVAFSLLNKALGKQKVLGLYIDNGFMRLDETEKIRQKFEKAGFDNLRMVNAEEIFLGKVKGVFEPEEKRKIIGQTFLDVKEREVEKMGLNSEEWLLGQGTIYPDIIESGGTKNADKIKTHHNRVDAITKLIEKGLVVEPLADFYKDEVRKIGHMLGVSDELIKRQPFPGPGLGIRCLCAQKNWKDPLFPKSRKKTEKFIGNNFKNLKGTLLPVKSVGVQGDNRTYAHPVLLWGESSWKFLDEASSQITNSLRETNRAVLWLNPKNDIKFELIGEDAFLTKERLDILRKADDIAMRNIREAGVYDEIWQFPVAMLPLVEKGDKRKRECIVLRPAVTRDIMTLHFYPMKKRLLQKITKEILTTGEISNVFFDITNKPPGPMEWE
jgi:GMP synthase (glutamine-hydrolysing)